MKAEFIRAIGTGAGKRIRSLLWYVVMIQLVIWLSDYWLNATSRAAIYSLTAVLFIEWIIPRVRIKPLIQFVAVVLVNVRLFWNVNDAAIDSETGLILALVNSHPFIWYALGTSFVFVVINAWASTKARAIYVLLTCLTALCIVDSFSLIILWDQIVIIVFCGLLIISALHFHEFKRKFPQSWIKLVQSPGAIVIPLVFLFAVMLFAGLQAPTLPPLLTDPYTAWKNAQGVEVEKRGKPLEDSPQYSSTSGYGRDDTQLGGSFLYDHSTVMTVESTRRAYWRGETLDAYDGKGWSRKSNLEPQKVSENTLLTSVDHWDLSKLESEQVKYTVTMATDEEYPVLFTAFRPERIESLKGATETRQPVIDWDPRHQVLISVNIYTLLRSYPESYTIVSQVPVLDEDGLRDAYNNRTSRAEVDEHYYQLPSDLPDRVKQLAEQVSSGESTIYDKVKAIETYLQTEYPYTNTPDESGAQSDDFVDRFLFEVQEGYCDYFSTAMVVMLRSQGIPARWVKGFTPGESDVLVNWDYFEGAPDPSVINGPATYTVRNSNAHSWVEVYFPGYGWIPFEPTPGYSFAYGVDEDQEVMAPLPQPQTPNETDPNEKAEETMDKSGSFQMKSVWIAAVVILIIIIVAGAFIILRKFGFPRLFMRKSESLDDTVIYIVEKFLAYAARKGMPRAEHETVREWVSHWGDNYRWLKDDLQSVQALFERARYQPHRITDEEVAQMKELTKRLRKQIRAARKHSRIRSGRQIL